MRLENCVIYVRRLNCVICLMAWLLLQWIDGATTAARGSLVRQEPPIKDGRFDLGTFRSAREYFIDHAKTIVFA
ncbi:hypothetical protein TNCV_3025231 [Trichonephila clavipes]|nr:hypothetical protein TNCV_3025231 [Trichonephila clavipes]